MTRDKKIVPQGDARPFTPSIMSEMMSDRDAKKRARVVQALLKMKKFDIETLKRAYQG